MALDSAKNFAKAAVSTGYASGVTSIVLVSGGGAKFPTAPFNATWWNSTDYADPAVDPYAEIIRVTVVSTDTLTITRAQEGTSDGNHNTAGKTYMLVAGPTAKLLTDILGISITGSAATLTTPRAINGVNFDGSAPITVTAAAGTLTGSTLAAGVTASSLTSVGALTDLTAANIKIAGNEIDQVATNADQALYINYHGYAGGDTQFRDLIIANGKTGAIATFDGSTGHVGIGTSAPGVELEIASVNDGGGGIGGRLRLQGLASDAYYYTTFQQTYGSGGLLITAVSFDETTTSLKLHNGIVTITTPPARVLGDKYLIIDSSGNIHVSATGPAS
jgi:hypothetical protein